ncbi:MAG TPA: LysR family transcriptional regulator [Sandaracinaceae bacterium LLY-WYZ-13_1]|nr:LysR family transcriptional regulator [Sandaracinaceae bacterium LLY-WYZ-13_1]
MDALELNLNHLRHFYAVASEGSLNGAARRLRVAPSTLSEQMRALEASLGQPLFDRVGGRLRLNDAGRRVQERVEEMLGAVRELLRDLEIGDEVRRPTVAVGVASTVSNAFTAEYFLPLFARDDLHVVIRHGDHPALLHQLLAHEIDLLLSEHSPSHPEDKGLRVRTVSRPELVAVATPSLAAKLSGSWPRSLEGAPYVNYTIHSSYRWLVDAFLASDDIRPTLVGEVDDLGVIRATAEHGICVAFLPESVTSSLDPNRLVELGRLPEHDGGVTAIYRHYEPPEVVLDAIESLLARA